MQALRSGQEHRLTVVFNPNGSNAGLVEPYILNAIRDHPGWHEPDVVHTRYSDPQDNARWLAESDELFEDGQIIIWAGGDSMGAVAAAISQHRPDVAKNAQNGNPDMVHYVLAPAGDANDSSTSLYGDNILRSGRLLDIVDGGRQTAVNGLRIVCNQLERRAFGYAGIGMSAEFSELKSDPQYRQWRPNLPLYPPSLKAAVNDRLSRIRDAEGVLWRFHHSPPVHYYRQQNGVVVPHIDKELLVLNLPVIGVEGRAQVDIEGPAIMTSFPEQRFWRTLTSRLVHEAFQDGLVGEVIDEPVELFVVGSRTVSRLWRRRREAAFKNTLIQLDGEVYDVPTGSELVIANEPRSVPVLLNPPNETA